MAHADDIGKYEGPPCEVCRVSQFIGTCTHRPRKYPEYTFPDFTTDEFQQMKAQKDKMLADQRSEIEKERDALKLQNRELQEQLQKLSDTHDEECRIQKVLLLQRDEAEKKAREANRLVGRLQIVVDAVVKRHKIWLAEEKGDIWQADAAAKVAISKYIGEQESVAVRQEIEKRNDEVLVYPVEKCEKCGRTGKLAGVACPCWLA